MVGGFVQQQQVGLLQQQLGQHHTHAPSSAEVAQGFAQLPGFKAQPFQDFFGFIIQLIAAQGAKLFLLFCQQVQGFVAVVGFYLYQQLVDFLFQLYQAPESLSGHLQDGF